MPVLAKMRPEITKTTIDFGYGPIEVTYKPRQIVDTAEDDDRRRREADDNDENYQANELCRILVAWDLTGCVPIEDIPGHAKGSAFAGSDDDVIPLDPAVVRFIDQPFLASLLAAITVDAQPDPTQMLAQSRRRGATPTSTKPNGHTDTPSLSPTGSMTS